MEIQHLRHIIAAHKTGNFAKAAKKCFTSRQNIAHSVKVIENRLGVCLFRRKGNEMIPTPEGIEFLQAAIDVVERIDNLSVMFVERNNAETALSIAISHNLFAGLPSSIDAYLDSYADRLSISERGCEQCYEMVLSNAVDAAIIMSMERKFPDCNTHKLGSSRVYAAVNAESLLAEKNEFTVGDAENHRFLLLSKPPFQYEPLFNLIDALGTKNIKVDVIASTSSMLYMIRKHKNSLAFVSSKFAKNPPPGIVVLPINNDQINWNFYVLFQSNASKFCLVSDLIERMQGIFDEERDAY